METKTVPLQEAGVCGKEADAGASIRTRKGVVSCWKQTSRSNYLNQIQTVSENRNEQPRLNMTSFRCRIRVHWPLITVNQRADGVQMCALF